VTQKRACCLSSPHQSKSKKVKKKLSERKRGIGGCERESKRVNFCGERNFGEKERREKLWREKKRCS
jgi:hypothetical protein